MGKNKHYLDIYDKKVGVERRYEFINEVLSKQEYVPVGVRLFDIDKAFKEWVEESIQINSPEGVTMPTISLYSSRRFSEYSQTWEYVDENRNLLLNFKTVTRKNNPVYGSIHKRMYNIPGDEYFIYKKLVVLDDNGSESIRLYKMKTPTSCDLQYELSIFTTKFEKINEFNERINHLFNSRQCYINPNGYYMAMVVDDISDNSSYNINDREFYSQTVQIKVLGYILLDEDFQIEEVPLKRGLMNVSVKRKRKADVYIEDIDKECYEGDGDDRFYYKPIVMTITFPPCINVSKFNIDTYFTVLSIEKDNVRHTPVIIVNGNEVKFEEGMSFVDYDEIKITINKVDVNKDAVITLVGYDRRYVYDKANDAPEFNENENKIQEIDIVAGKET